MSARTKLELWMREHPALVEFGPSVFFAKVGILGGILIGIQANNLEAGLAGAVCGAVLGWFIGPYLVSIPLMALWCILIVAFPSRRLYPVVGLSIGLLGACIQSWLRGFVAAEWMIEFCVYGLMALMACELTHGVWKHWSPKESRSFAVKTDG